MEETKESKIDEAMKTCSACGTAKNEKEIHNVDLCHECFGAKSKDSINQLVQELASQVKTLQESFAKKEEVKVAESSKGIEETQETVEEEKSEFKVEELSDGSFTLIRNKYGKC